MFTRLLALIFISSAATTSVFAQWGWADVSNSNNTNYVRVQDVAVDESNGWVYSAGFISGNSTFSALPNSIGDNDAFVIKYDLNGGILWGFRFGGTGKDRVNGITIDPNSNNILVTGFVGGSAVDFQGAFPGAPSSAVGSAGGQDAFVACYNVLGQLLWHRIIGGTNMDRGMDIAANSTGTFVTGFYTNTAVLSGISTVIPADGVINNFVLALNSSNGNTLWDAVLASESSDYSAPITNSTIKRLGITADDNGIYLVNYFNGVLFSVYNSSGIVSTTIADPNFSAEDFVVTSYTNTGNHNWSVLYDNDGTVSFGLDIANDCSGVYVTGTLHNTGVTPGGTVISSAHDNFILSKLNKLSGSEIWLKEFQSSSNHLDHFVGIDTDDFGNIYAIGRLRGTTVSEGTNLNFTGGTAFQEEVMIAHYTSDGEFKSFELLSGSDDSWGMSIATYEDDKYFVGGHCNDDLFFGGIWSGSTFTDGFVAGRDISPPLVYASSTGSEIFGTPAFCQSELTATPDLNTPVGGTFSGPAQVVFNNASTGEIDLVASTPGGPYTISYSGSAFVCSVSPIEFDIYINSDDDASFAYVDTSFCASDPDPTASSITTALGTFSGPPELVITDASTGEIDLSASTPGGPYWLVYTTSGFYCPSSDSIQIIINAVPNANFGYSQTSYCSGTGWELPNFVVTGGGTFLGQVGLVINSTTGEINLNTSTPGATYSIQHTVGAAGCQSTETFNVTIPPVEDASFTFTNTAYCTTDANALPWSVATPGGVFSASTGLTVANASTGEIEFSSSTPGTHQLYYTTGGACSEIDSLEFTITAVLDPTIAYAQSSYCLGSGTILPSFVASPGGTFSAPVGVVFVDNTTGEIDLNTSIAGGPYAIQYTTPPSPCQTSSSYNLTFISPDDASFTYAGSNFCQNEADPSPTSITTPSGTFSSTAGLVLNPSSGLIDVSASLPGPYWLVYTTPGPNCPASDSIQITIEDTPNPSFSYAQWAYCDNELNPVPDYIATPGGLFSAPVGLDVNPLTGEIDLTTSTPGGPYAVQYLVSNTYCSDSVTFNVTINPVDDASFTYAGSNFCQNEADPSPTSITTPSGTFSSTAGLVVNPSSGLIDVSASSLGSYWLVYTTSGANCPSSDSIQISIEDIPNSLFSYAQSAYCGNDANPVPDYIATPGGLFTAPTGLDVNPLTGEIDLTTSTPGGPYAVQYLVSNTYCSDSTTFNVTINSVDDASFGYSAGVFCQNEANPLPTFVVTPGGVFTASAGIAINPLTGEIDLASSSTGTNYFVTYTTNGVCPDSDVDPVLINDAPNPMFTYAQTAYCSNEVNPFPNSIATAGGAFSGPAGLSIDPFSGEIDLANSTAGTTYTIQYIASNTYCQDTATFDVTINQIVDASFAYATDHFCNNEANPSPISIATAGGTFSAQSGLSVDGVSGEINVTSSTVGGPYWLVYTVSSPTCPASDSIQVYIESAPDATFDYAQTSFCQGLGTTVLPSSITTSGGTFSAPAGVLIDATTGEIDIDASLGGGPYSIQYTVSNAYCQKTQTFDITIVEQDQLTSMVYPSNKYCVSDANQFPQVTGVTGGTFTGPTSINIVDPSSGEISPLSSLAGGPYAIQYLTSGACPDSIEFEISISDLVSAYAGEDQELFFVLSSTLEADLPVNANGQWSSVSDAFITDEFDPNSNVSNLEIGINTFVWTVSNEVCPAVSDEVIIEVQDIYIPQAVTPNNDGKNDLFELHSLDEVTCSLQIFNRWGQLVYENTDYQNEWNGQSSKGDELKNDTYFYTMLINDSLSYNGYIVLKK